MRDVGCKMSEITSDPDESVVRRAIDWHLRLGGARGAEHARLVEAIDSWCAECPSHARAWARVTRLTGEFDDMRRRLPEPAASLQILNRTGRELDRRRTLKLLLAGCAVGGSGLWLAQTHHPWRADYATRVGERRQLTLADGTRVTLNTDSALDVAFTPAERRLVLQGGEVMIESGTDAASPRHRPLRLACRHGLCEALGTRFSVRDAADISQLSVSEGRVALTQTSSASRIIESGETVRFDGTRTLPVRQTAVDPEAWSEGMLVVNDIRLAAFLDELARYRRGFVNCDARVAGLRLSGVFQLDSQPALLRHLERTLPVRIVSRTRWWISVEPV